MVRIKSTSVGGTEQKKTVDGEKLGASEAGATGIEDKAGSDESGIQKHQFKIGRRRAGTGSALRGSCYLSSRFATQTFTHAVAQASKDDKPKAVRCKE